MSGVDPMQDRPGDVDAAARDWVLRLVASDDAAETAGCAAWRDAHPAHDAAFWKAWTLFSAAGQTEVALGDDWRAEAEALRARRSPLARFLLPKGKGARKAWTFGVPAGLAASVALLVGVWGATSAPGLAVATRVAETRVVALDDGSKITVGGKTEIEAFVDTRARRVRLDKGQAFFEVAHDPSRPFTVVAGDAEITVRGTKFDVRRIGDDVEVNVLEGRVEVRRRGVLTFLTAGAPDAVLTAGQASELKPAADSFAAAAPATASAGEWRSGRLFYADAPLSDIVADARRYTNSRIELADGVGGLSLTVSYRAGDIEGLKESLEAALPVRVERRNDGLVVVPAGEK